MASALSEWLALNTREGEIYQKLTEGRVRCFACGHRCRIPMGRSGICKVRFNRDGVLQVPYGYVAGLAVDPVEKKPFYHLLPGARALSFGMLGCSFHCAFCQNWVSSQVLRDPQAMAAPERMSPEAIAEAARSYATEIVTSTYNEPLITAEWAVAIFKHTAKEGRIGSFVSNGNATPEVLDYLRPYVTAYKVDLKTFVDRNYRRLGGTLQGVLDTIRRLHQLQFWVEVVTLVVPGFNDSDHELREIARFLCSVSPDIPWHVTAYHRNYRMTDRRDTDTATLLRAAEIGVAEGVRFVYAGNLPGSVDGFENTYCPGCKALLVERVGFRVKLNRMLDGACPDCGRAIPGLWKTPAPPLNSVAW